MDKKDKKKECIIVSRLDITGYLDSTTPKVVLLEIAEVHGIDVNVDKLWKVINRRAKNKLVVPYNNYSWQFMARYVNSEYSWSKRILLKAFEHLQSFIYLSDTDLSNEQIFKDFNGGKQSPENPYSYNACVLYKLCRKYNIFTYVDMTMKEMENSIKLLLCTLEHKKSEWQQVKTQILDGLIYENVPPHIYVNIFNMLKNSRVIQDVNIDYECEDVYRFDYKELDILSYEWRNMYRDGEDDNLPENPKNGSEAVVLAAIRFKMDISDVKYPIIEYKALKRVNYYPVDARLGERLRKANKDPYIFCNPRLDQMFNPKLPMGFYSREDISKFCKNQGVSIEERFLLDNVEDKYITLRESYLLCNFYQGRQEDIVSNTTFYEEEVEDLSLDTILCFGVYGEKLKVYTYQILNDIFVKAGNFRDIATNGNYENYIVNKLEKLATRSKQPGETEEDYNMRLELHTTIKNTRLLLNSLNELTETFKIGFELAKEDVQNQVVESLKKLMDVAMYMRGWKGEGPYPLKSSDTSITEEERPMADLRVTQSIITFENENDMIKDNILNVMSLPLMFYRNHKFVPSSEIKDGFTIYDRIAIVREGEKGTIKSCIRMTSNSLAASAYYYLTLIGQKPTFSIDKLMYIS